MNFRLARVIVQAVLGWIGRSSLEEENTENIVHLPKRFLWIGIIGTVLTSVIFGILLFTSVPKEDLWLAIPTILIFLFLGLFLIISYFNWRIEFDEDGFTHKTFWGIKRRYKYTDIVGLDEEDDDKQLKVKNHYIVIDLYAENSLKFIDFAKRRYRKENGNRAIPKLTKKFLDPFNGHIKNHFIYVVLDPALILFFLFMGIVLVNMVLSSIDPSKNEHFELTFNHYQTEKKSLKLYSDSADLPFSIYDYENKVDNLHTLLSNCNSLTEFDVMAEKFEPSDGSPFYRIHQLSDKSGLYYTTYEKTYADDKDMLKIAIGFPALAISLCILHYILLIIYGRNPKKYKHKKSLTNFFFHKNVIKW